MAGDNAASEPQHGESSRDQEKPQAEVETTQQQQQPQTGRDASQENEDRPLPPLPQRPLPVSHQETRKRQSVLPPPHGAVHFGPMPIDDATPVHVERPFYPRWHRTKLGLMVLSLMVSAVIFGVGVAIGYHNAPYMTYTYGGYPIDFEFGLSGAAAGLAVLVTVAELVTLCLSSRREGMLPGAHVAFQLLIWLLALVAVVLTGIYATDSYAYDGSYDYPEDDITLLWSRSQVLEQVLLAFDCLLLAIHFILFVGACVETNRYDKAKRRVVVVRVPVPAGAPYPGGQYPPPPVYGHGAQPGQHQHRVSMMSQVPPPPGGEGTGLIPPQAAVYGGYYAPASQQVAWTTAPQQNDPRLVQGYYAPAPAPAHARRASNPGRHSRRSQRHSQTHVQPQAQSQAESSAQPTQ